MTKLLKMPENIKREIIKEELLNEDIIKSLQEKELILIMILINQVMVGVVELLWILVETHVKMMMSALINCAVKPMVFVECADTVVVFLHQPQVLDQEIKVVL